jgi:nucleotide-binding universal stress UspA family protein
MSNQLRIHRRGSADRLMRRHPSLGDHPTMDNTPILICYDGSPGAARAIEAAATLLGPRRAVVLDVAPPITPVESVATIGTLVPGASFEQLNTADAAQVAARGAELARSWGFEAEARGTFGAPTWEEVVDVADELGASVVVIGSRGLRGMRETLEGSLSHQVAEHAGRPVLIVPPPRPSSG